MNTTTQQLGAMHQAPVKQERYRFTFEAFGQKHTAYAALHYDEKMLEHLVQQISPTARITELCTDLVDESTFRQLNVTKLEDWHNRILQKFGSDA